MTYTSKLPDQPSALIRLALGDLQKCMADPVYKIDMRHWHMPADDESNCSVCLAGAVLAQTFKMLPSTLIHNLHYYLSDPNDSDKLAALDDFRTGDLVDGLIVMGFDPQGNSALDGMGQLNGGLAPFDADDPKIFFDDMNTIADALERCGY